MAMEMEWNQDDNGPYLKVKGEVDVFNAPQFSKLILSAVKEKPESLRIDLSELKNISSAGLRVFVLAGKELASKQKKLVIRLPTDPKVEEIFYLSGLYSIFDIQAFTPK